MMDFIQFDQSEIKSVKAYWTDKRMANAIPLPLPQGKIPEICQQEDDQFSQADTEMVFCAAEFKPRSIVPVYYAGKVRDMSIDPYRKVGKLYCTYSDDRDYYSATAQFVGADNVLMTAGHSVKPDGKWAKNIMFYRASNNEPTIEKGFKAVVNAASINSMWYKITSHPAHSGWDYAFLKTTEPSDVGYLELSLKLPFLLKSVGYTASYGNQARYMCELHGSLVKYAGNIVAMRPNFMESGASGGGWFSRHGGNEIVGLTSGFAQGKKGLKGNGKFYNAFVYGPRFNQETVNQFKHFLSKSDSI